MKLDSERLKRIDVSKLKYPGTNETYEQVLRKSIKNLYDCIYDEMLDYYENYTPRIYKRGFFNGSFLDSMDIDSMIYINAINNTLSCKINITDDALHTSIVTGAFGGNSFWLLNNGWEVTKDVWFRDIPRFGYFDGANFVEKGIKRFKSKDKYGLTIKVNIPPELY